MRLGVHYGSARIGVARSDPDGLLASPLTTVPRGPGDLDRLVSLALTHQAVEVVVGLPTSLSGRAGAAAAAATDFATALAGRLNPLPVRLVDERFTTVLAHDALRQGGKGGRARRPVVDQAAAALLLQGALDAERATGRPPGQPVSPAPGEHRVSRHARRGTQGEQDWEPGNYPPPADSGEPFPGGGYPPADDGWDPGPQADEARVRRGHWRIPGRRSGYPEPSRWPEHGGPGGQQPPGPAHRDDSYDLGTGSARRRPDGPAARSRADGAGTLGAPVLGRPVLGQARRTDL